MQAPSIGEEKNTMLVHVKRLQSRMDAEGLDGIVGTTLANVFYFAGFTSMELADFPYDGQVYAVVTRDEPTKPVVVMPVGEIDQVLDGFPLERAIGYGRLVRKGPLPGVSLSQEEQWLKSVTLDTPAAAGPLEGLFQALEHLRLEDKRIGIDELGFRKEYLEKLAKRFPRARFVPVSDLLRSVRVVKTPAEVERLRAVARMTEQAMLAAASIAREGITEYELCREFERSIVSQGGQPRFTLIRVGRNGIAGQRRPDRTPLARGDTIWFDTGARYDGYWSDLARTFSLGEPSARVRQIYNALLEGEKAGIAATRVGMTASEIFHAAMDAARRAGHPEYERHHVGHGIGLEVYEGPSLSPTSKEVIEEGMVINIETPYYEFGLGALHVEDPYIVTVDGRHTLLTTLGRELQVLDG
jgi:Xaa-Pro aminopeptidase